MAKITEKMEGTLSETQAYCMRCCDKREILDAEKVEIKSKLGLKGRCGECDATLFKWTASKSKNRPAGYYEERKRRAKLRKRKEEALGGLSPVSVSFTDNEVH